MHIMAIFDFNLLRRSLLHCVRIINTGVVSLFITNAEVGRPSCTDGRHKVKAWDKARFMGIRNVGVIPVTRLQKLRRRGRGSHLHRFGRFGINAFRFSRLRGLIRLRALRIREVFGFRYPIIGLRLTSILHRSFRLILVSLTLNILIPFIALRGRGLVLLGITLSLVTLCLLFGLRLSNRFLSICQTVYRKAP